MIEADHPFTLRTITVQPTRAKHDEVLDDVYSLGLVFEAGQVKVGFTGDTGWDIKRKFTIRDRVTCDFDLRKA